MRGKGHIIRDASTHAHLLLEEQRQNNNCNNVKRAQIYHKGQSESLENSLPSLIFKNMYFPFFVTVTSELAGERMMMDDRYADR